MNIFERHRSLFLIEGIIFILLGILAIALPQVTTLAVELFLGWLLLIGGVVQAIRAFTSKEIPGFWPTLIGGLISAIVGVLLLAYPIAGVISLTLLLTLFFIADGISKLVFAYEYKGASQLGWLAFSGIVSLILAFIIWSGWPGTASWVIGLMVGINMLFFGITLLSLTCCKKDV